jgi:hypothetical protein
MSKLINLSNRTMLRYNDVSFACSFTNCPSPGAIRKTSFGIPDSFAETTPAKETPGHRGSIKEATSASSLEVMRRPSLSNPADEVSHAPQIQSVPIPAVCFRSLLSL